MKSISSKVRSIYPGGRLASLASKLGFWGNGGVVGGLGFGVGFGFCVWLRGVGVWVGCAGVRVGCVEMRKRNSIRSAEKVAARRIEKIKKLIKIRKNQISKFERQRGLHQTFKNIRNLIKSRIKYDRIRREGVCVSPYVLILSTFLVVFCELSFFTFNNLDINSDKIFDYR